MKFVTRAYNNIVLNREFGTITKTSKEQRLGDEIQFYLNLPKSVQHRFPRVVSWESSPELHKLELEYYPFNNLGNLLASGEPYDGFTKLVAAKLRSVWLEFCHIKYEFPQEKVESWTHDMYVGKTEREYKALRDNFPWFTDFCKNQEIVVNEVSYKNFEPLWNGGLKEFVKSEYCDIVHSNPTDFLSFMHGDLCFSNILCSQDKNFDLTLKFVDPRGSFGTKGCHGNPYYDLAKLMHSVDGRYESIIFDRFSLDETRTQNEITFSMFYNLFADQVKATFEQEIFKKPQVDFLKIRVIQGLIYLGMCARHFDSVSRQKVMYATGIRILNECWNEIQR